MADADWYGLIGSRVEWNGRIATIESVDENAGVFDIWLFDEDALEVVPMDEVTYTSLS